MYDDKGQRAMDRETYARSHRIRAKILTLYEEDEGRSLTAVALLGDMADEDISLPVVAYHVQVLQEAGLIPKDE